MFSRIGLRPLIQNRNRFLNLSKYTRHINTSGPVKLTALTSEIPIQAIPNVPQPIIDESVNGTILTDTIPIAIEKLQSISQIGDLESLGLCSWFTPVGYIERLLETVHVFGGMEWIGTIALTVVIFRIALFPLAAKAQRSSVMLQNVKPFSQVHMDRAEVLKRNGDTQGAKQQFQKSFQVMKDRGVNPATSALLALSQIPLFIAFFLALRKMADVQVPGLSTGGALWFPDLTMADPFCVLPFISALTILAGMEINPAAKEQTDTMRFAFRGMAIASIPIFAYLPTSVMIYTVLSGIIAVIQSILLRSPAIKKYFDIPEAIVVEGNSTTSGLLKLHPMSYAEANKRIQSMKLTKQHILPKY